MRVPSSGLYLDNPAFPLLQGLISYWGITDADGNAGGTTVVCGNLATEPNYDGHPVKILSGPAAGQTRTIEVHAGNALTVGVPFSNNPAGAVQQITAGTLFVILSILGGGGGPGPAPAEGLSYYGVVDAVPGANQFTIGGLAGLGAGKFDGATNPYYAFVLRDAGGAGAAPQGEQQAITTYVTATGTFTTNAFTVAVAVGDEILILHPDVAAALVILADLAVPAADSVANALERDVIGNKTDTAQQTVVATASFMRYIKGLITALGNPTGDLLASIAAKLGNPAQDFNTMVGYEGATALANKLTAARAAFLDSLNTGVLVNSQTSAFSRLAGRTQVFTKNITSAANVGDVVVATITTQPCFIKRIALRSNGATTVDLTSAAIYGGAGKVVTFIDSATGARANIDVADKQVAWAGAATFATTKTIVITLTGTGVTAVNLQVDIEYEAIADGGYLA